MQSTIKLGEFLSKFVSEMGFMGFFTGSGYLNAIMIVISFVLLYLAIVKKYEPLLLLPYSIRYAADKLTICESFQR